MWNPLEWYMRWRRRQFEAAVVAEAEQLLGLQPGALSAERDPATKAR